MFYRTALIKVIARMAVAVTRTIPIMSRNSFFLILRGPRVMSSLRDMKRVAVQLCCNRYKSVMLLRFTPEGSKSPRDDKTSSLVACIRPNNHSSLCFLRQHGFCQKDKRKHEYIRAHGGLTESCGYDQYFTF